MNDGNDYESETKSPQTPAENIRNNLSPEDLYTNLVKILPANPNSVDFSIQIKQKRRLNAEDEEEDGCFMYGKSTSADATATLTESEAAKKFLQTEETEPEAAAKSTTADATATLTESEAARKFLRTPAESGTISSPPTDNATLNAEETIADRESSSSSLSEKEAATKYLQTPAEKHGEEDEVTNPRDTNAILEMVLNPTRETTYSYTTDTSSTPSSAQDKEDEADDEKGESVVPSSNEIYEEDETANEDPNEAGQDREVEKGARTWTDDTTPKLPTPSGQDVEGGPSPGKFQKEDNGEKEADKGASTSGEDKEDEKGAATSADSTTVSGQDKEGEKADGSSSSPGAFIIEVETEKGGASKDGYSSDSSTTLSGDEAAEKFLQKPDEDNDSDKEDPITNPRDTNAILSMVLRQNKNKKS